MAPTADGTIALGHNGNLTNSHQLADLIAARGQGESRDKVMQGNTTDTMLITALLGSHPDPSLEDAAVDDLAMLRGAFSLVFMDESTLYAARDPQGIRPLVLGRLERGWVVASETAALDIVGASLVREVEPGELIACRRPRPADAALRARQSRAAASSSTCTWPDPTPPSATGRCTRLGSRWGGASPGSTRSRPTW